MTKTEFFDLMIANRNYINRDSVVTVNSRNTVYVKSVGIANTGISSHKTEAAALVACEKYSRWFAEWLHVEALAINDAYNTLYVYAPGDAAREVWEQLTAVERVVSVECAHKEELAMVQESRLIDCLFNPALIGADHAEALAINEAFDARKVGEAPQILWDILPAPTKRIAVHNCHVKALAMNDAIRRWSRPGATSNEHLKLSIDKAHAEALEMDATYSAIIADRNATLELSGALGRDVLQKSIVMLKCQTVGEVSGEVKEGDTVTVSLQDQNGNKITVTGEVEEILE